MRRGAARLLSPRLWKWNNIIFTPIQLVKVNPKASPDSMSKEEPTFEGKSSSVSYKETWAAMFHWDHSYTALPHLLFKTIILCSDPFHVIFFIEIEIYLIYNVVLVLSIQHSDSVFSGYISL